MAKIDFTRERTYGKSFDGVLKIQGHVSSEENLPLSAESGDIYLVGEDNALYIFNGEWKSITDGSSVSSDDVDTIISLTQSEYDGLSEKDPKALYIITDTGKMALGSSMISGTDGVGVQSVVQTTVSQEDGGTNVWTITLTNGQTSTLQVKNGNQGNSGYSGAAGELEVVNNLVDGGATSALSAEMGKTLNTNVSQLRSEVDNTALSLVLGSLAIADGAEQSSTTRARTDYLYTAGELVFDPDVEVSCRYYNSSKVFQFSDSAWTTESPYSFNKNYPITRIVVAYSNDAVISDVSTLASKVKIKGVVERVEELEERADKGIKLSEPLKAKTIGDFVKYPISGYYAKIDKDYKSNANYETYILPADGAKYVSAHIKGDATATAGVTCWSDPNPNTASRVKKIDNINGEQDVFFEVPSGTEQITFSSLSGTLDFTIYYEELPQVPANTLYIDELLNSDQSGGKIISNPTYNDRRVITKSICAFPYAGLKVKAHMPFNVRASFKITPSEGTQTVGESFGGWIYDGAELTFPYYGVEYRIVFAPQSPDTTTTTLPATYIRNCINAGLIWFSYETTEAGVVARNYDKDARVGAVKRTLTGLEDGMDSLFTFGHISDIHGDSVRFANFMDYLKAKGVDAALNSGDAVMFNAFDYTSFCKNIAAQYSIPYFFCIGNHESQPTGQTTLYEDNIQELVSPYGYLKAVDTPADNCYYYRDFSEKKIRLIVINYYNNGIYDGSLGQAQINWFIGVLASTPSGYGVLIMNHAAEDKVAVPSQYDAFFQKVRWTTGERSIRNMGGSKPIMNIVDAFISRTALSTSFSDNGTTVTVSADFSGITDDTIEFIAYVTGHSHEDYIGYYDNSINKQLVLGITCGNALYGYGTNKALANQEDLPRGGEGVCQDAFNIYSVDRVHKRVKIARIGADLNFNFEPREYMAIPYAE